MHPSAAASCITAYSAADAYLSMHWEGVVGGYQGFGYLIIGG